MSSLLVSHRLHARLGPDLERIAREAGLELAVLPEDREGRLTEDAIARIEVAFFSADVNPDFARQFFSAVRKAPNVKWLHVFNAGVDHPIFTEMLERGVRITTSSGTTAVPIAQTAITALLMLGRNWPRWLTDQREHRWNPMRTTEMPPDLQGQVAVIVGMGHIGKEIGRLARALGLTVIGVRRSPLQPGDPVDEMQTPEKLPEILPRADWLILACPLTEETRGLVDADLLARLPKTARLMNVGRGEVVDEPALIEALQSGSLAGAYLDVFAKEPLPPESPLWDMPNVLVTPHNSIAAGGNEQRVYEVFADNLRRWKKGEPLVNEVKAK
jgi:phosphoglycerate dehydrogenase-like enzyme